MATTSAPVIAPAQVSIDDNGIPRSQRFDDIYFNPEHGIEEVTHVFIDGNRLSERWSQSKRLTVGETGFGSGLNLLVTAQRWLAEAPAEAQLHWLSVERYPLDVDQLQRIHCALPGQAELSAELREQWPPAVPGFHRISLAGGRIHLTLILAEAQAGFREAEAQVDAWYLDGFAPARNPDMWQPALFAQLARLSAPGATLATFTAAGQVRRDLTAAGFDMQRRPGFGRKREMLVGRLHALPADNAPAWRQPPPPYQGEKRIAIIGAGLTGSACARTFARRGWQVDLFDSADGPAQGASGNPAGACYPQLSRDHKPASRLSLAGFLHALREGNQLRQENLNDGTLGHGVLCLDENPRHGERQRSIGSELPIPDALLRHVDASTASKLAGVDLTQCGLWHPLGHWLCPPRRVQARLDSAGDALRCHWSSAVSALQRENEQWALLGDMQQTLGQYPLVILANSIAALNLEQSSWLDMEALGGQVSQPSLKHGETGPQVVISHGGYVIPADHGRCLIGASYRRGAPDNAVRDADHDDNRDRLQSHLPQIARQLDFTAMPGRAAQRAATPDRVALIGPLPDYPAMLDAYAPLRRGQPLRWCPAMPVHPGLWLSLGHGSHGLTSTALAAELLADRIEGTPLPMERTLAELQHPARFTLRRLMRNQ